MSKPNKKMNTTAKREETMRQIITGEMPSKDVVAALYDEVKFPAKPIYDNN